MNYLDSLVLSHKSSEMLGIPSICSAHPFVIEAALQYGLAQKHRVLIEATCNQVNQFGGYTGKKPAEFYLYVTEMANKIHFPLTNLMLGGDHLGPRVWSNETATQAMEKAKELVQSYVSAGFGKIHLDCSVPCVDDQNLCVEEIANRTAELVVVAEKAATDLSLNPDRFPRYIVGSEVPTAGGTIKGGEELSITRPEDVAETIQLTRKAFISRGLETAWQRVVALVVQPGVEFGDDLIHDYNREKAAVLSRFIEGNPGLIYEAHSTDYQSRDSLRKMTEDHFGILKVGPALTFAFREAVFVLTEIEDIIVEGDKSHLREVLESTMIKYPAEWQKHYSGSTHDQKIARAFSFSDRIRYYWNYPEVSEAFSKLLYNLNSLNLPLSLISQYFPKQYENIRAGKLENRPRNLVFAHVTEKLEDYHYACFHSDRLE